MWLIIRKSDSAVIGTNYTKPPVWDSGQFELAEWHGPEPAIHDPDLGIESYAPRPGEYDTHRIGFDGLANKAKSEIAYLEGIIPEIDTLDAPQVRTLVRRLAQENLEMLRAWRYVLKRLGN